MENENINSEMSADNNQSIPASSTKSQKLSKNTIALICVTAVLVLVLIGLVICIGVLQKMLQAPPTEPSTEPSTTVAEPDPSESEDPSEELPKEWVMLEHMAELYAQNPDTAGWIKIEDTKVDYPVMYTPDDEWKYLRLGFDEKFLLSGLPFIEEECNMDPEEESKSLIIYAHNMGNGTAFGEIDGYKDQKFWEEHPYISFSTLYEERTYEVVAAFYDRVYYNYEQVFKFYQFIDPETAEEYEEANAEYKSKAEYDTGVEIKDGDRLITLVTCSYHTKDGRFVVVARQVTDEEMAEREALATEE